MILEKVFDRIYPIVLVAGVLALTVSLIQTSIGAGPAVLFVIHVLLFCVFLAVTLLRRRLTPALALFLILVVIYTIAVLSLFNRGLAGSGMIHLIYFSILAGVYFGLLKGMILLTLSLATLTLAGIGICSGVVATKPDAVAYLMHPVNWSLHAACMVLYAVPLILTMKGIHLKMTESRQALMLNNRCLEEQMDVRRSIETQLRESEEKYRNIFERAIEGIFLVEAGGNLVGANPALAKMLGYDTAERVIAEIDNLEKQLYVHVKDRERLLRLFETKGEVIGEEIQMYKKDRSIIWVSVYGRAIFGKDGAIRHYEGSLADISKRKHAEQALIRSEANYRNVIENSVAGFFIIQAGLFRYVNQRAYEMTGYDSSDVIDHMPSLKPIHPDDLRDVEASIAHYLAGNKDAIPFEARVLCKDGTVITARFFISRILYNNEAAVSGTFIDVSREKKLASQLRQAQKMEAIGQLAGGIAHDFNNILTAFNGYGSILQIKMPKDDPLRIYVDHILSAAQKATSLTQNLLTFSRQQPITLVPVDVNRNIQDTEKLLKRLLTEDIDFTLRLSEYPAIILADASQIDRIFFNLFANARDAMPQGGQLRMETALDVFDERFWKTHGFGKPGRYVRISLSDTGIGMDRATKDQIFNPFFTTKAHGHGTGLGLATVYGIVKQHDGYILVDSIPGQGTAFHIYFPAIDAVADEEQSPPIILQSGKGTILVADDNEDVRSFIKDVFDLSGYETIEAVDGEDALIKFRQAPSVDLVILDSVMPKMNGRRVFDEMIKVRPDIKALFISGYTRDVVLDKGIRERDIHFLTKPLSAGLLLEKVRKILDS